MPIIRRVFKKQLRLCHSHSKNTNYNNIIDYNLYLDSIEQNANNISSNISNNEKMLYTTNNKIKLLTGKCNTLLHKHDKMEEKINALEEKLVYTRIMCVYGLLANFLLLI